MKTLSVYLGIIGILYSNCFAQSNIETVAQEYCNKLNEINLNQEKNNINQKSLALLEATYADNEEAFRKFAEEYSTNYPNRTQMQITRAFGREVTYFLMKGCVPYQRITMFQNKPVPVISAVTEKVGSHMSDLLTDKSKTEKISRDLVDECLDKAITIYTKDIIKHFGTLNSEKFTNELTAYLMTRCDPYIRWTVSLMK
jgi:hypothetical protein